MKTRPHIYKILVHCKFPQIRHGFEASLSLMPVDVQTDYVDLSVDGIISHLRFKPDLIVVLLNERDADFGLPLKIKLFANKVPLMVILPAVPERYYYALRVVGVDRVIQLPMNDQQICDSMMRLLQTDDAD